MACFLASRFYHKFYTPILYHWLAQTEANVQSTVANTDSTDTETTDDAIDDAVIEEGDEHRIQISGAPIYG